jgi:D-sedoheptulose 7-phosphate isomerase
MGEWSSDGLVAERLAEHLTVAHALVDASLHQQVAAVGDLFVRTYRAGGQILFAGNGGSAAQAAHAAGEFVGRCTRERGPLPALALTDASVLTALANDYGYDEVFVRQVIAHGRPGDVFVGLSTSGRSPSIMRGLEAARSHGLTTVALTGGDGGLLPDAADHVLLVPSARTGPIQEVHALWCHIWAEAVELALFES